MKSAHVLALLALLNPVAARAGDALTQTLEQETKRGTTAEKNDTSRAPVPATMEGVLLKDCAKMKNGPCDVFYYIVLPKQLDELMTGRMPMSEKKCRENNMPMGCAKSIQLEARGHNEAVLEELVKHRVKAVGIITEGNSPSDHRPAVMRVEKLTDLGSR